MIAYIFGKWHGCSCSCYLLQRIQMILSHEDQMQIHQDFHWELNFDAMGIVGCSDFAANNSCKQSIFPCIQFDWL